MFIIAAYIVIHVALKAQYPRAAVIGRKNLFPAIFGSGDFSPEADRETLSTGF